VFDEWYHLQWVSSPSLKKMRTITLSVVIYGVIGYVTVLVESFYTKTLD
jgi:hypothetical protein